MTLQEFFSENPRAAIAFSGGVDSSVVAALLIKAIGKQLICVHVNHGSLSWTTRDGWPRASAQG